MLEINNKLYMIVGKVVNLHFYCILTVRFPERQNINLYISREAPASREIYRLIFCLEGNIRLIYYVLFYRANYFAKWLILFHEVVNIICHDGLISSQE